MRFRPTADNVILLVEKGEQMRNGIVIPGNVSLYGRGLISALVVSIGPGVKQWAVDVSPGERVIVSDTAGELVVVGQDIAADMAPDYEAGTEFRVVRNEEILGVVP